MMATKINKNHRIDFNDNYCQFEDNFCFCSKEMQRRRIWRAKQRW